MKNKLNTLLSDLVVFYHKLQGHHWYVKGIDFFEYHEKLNGFYNEVNEQIDEIAEVMLMEEFMPVASLEQFLRRSNLSEFKGEFIKPKEILKDILTDAKYLLGTVLEIKKDADKEGNYFISDKMDDLISYYKKMIWMLKQSLMD